MNKLPIVEGLARRALALDEMMGETQGTNHTVSKILLAAIPVFHAADVCVKNNNDIAAADLQQALLTFDERLLEIFEEHQ